MAFIRSFVVTAVVMALLYLGLALALLRAPVPAEYWVREMIVVKKHLAKALGESRPKIVVAGGSSALFGIDAAAASEKLGMPVINFGLHASLPLKKLLADAGSVTARGDVLILALEPPYYDCNDKLNTWQVANILGWDHEALAQMGWLEKLEFVAAISPDLLMEMYAANVARAETPDILRDRLNALDDHTVLQRFAARTAPQAFAYSAFHLNDHGDMQKTEGSTFRGRGYQPGFPNHVCEGTARRLHAFVGDMKRRGVTVFFANAPYIDTAGSAALLAQGEASFKRDIAPIGCMIDRRQDLVFDRNQFLNSMLHLNAEGRAHRTDLLVQAIRQKVLGGGCSVPPAAAPTPSQTVTQVHGAARP